MEKRKKGVYGPPNRKTAIVFIDDLNMPRKEEWGAQQPIELIRQYLDHKAWYIMKLNKEYTFIEDLIILGAMGPPGGGRNEITNRLVRHFNVNCTFELNRETVTNIFLTILNHFLGSTNEKTRDSIHSIIQLQLNLFENIKSTLLPTPKKIHYIFNLRDISNVF